MKNRGYKIYLTPIVACKQSRKTVVLDSEGYVLRSTGAAGKTRVRLSPRERQVLLWTFAGLSTKEISESLGITPGSVDQCMAAVLNGTGISGRREIARYVLENTNLLALDEGVLCDGTWSDTGHHPPGCKCPAVYCTAMRVATDPKAFEEYRRQRAGG